MAPLTVVTFKWNTPGYRSKFEARHVDTLRRMVRRHYPHPHRFVLCTDDPRGLEERDIEVVELWDDFAEIPNPSGHRNPSCYRRLRLFSGNAGEWLGPRFVCIDLDTVICGDLTPLWHRREDFVIWGDTNRVNPYNGSMFLLTAGARREVWENFDPEHSPRRARQAGYFGSDQAWFAYVLGPGEKKWSQRDGVFSWRNDLRQRYRNTLPANARVVFFHGREDPWHPATQRFAPWIAQHYK